MHTLYLFFFIRHNMLKELYDWFNIKSIKCTEVLQLFNYTRNIKFINKTIKRYKARLGIDELKR